MAPAPAGRAAGGARARSLRRARRKIDAACRRDAGQGLLVCNELHPKRARILASNLERWGATNALVLNEHPARLAERFPAFFRPHSGRRALLRRGDVPQEDAAVADWSEETVRMCADRQAEILRSGADACARRAAGLFDLHLCARGERGQRLAPSARAPRFFRRDGRRPVVRPGAAGMVRRPRAGAGAYLPPLAA